MFHPRVVYTRGCWTFHKWDSSVLMIRDTILLQNCSLNLGQMFSVLGLHGWRKSKWYYLRSLTIHSSLESIISTSKSRNSSSLQCWTKLLTDAASSEALSSSNPRAASTFCPSEPFWAHIPSTSIDVLNSFCPAVWQPHESATLQPSIYK